MCEHTIKYAKHKNKYGFAQKAVIVAKINGADNRYPLTETAFIGIQKHQLERRIPQPFPDI